MLYNFLDFICINIKIVYLKNGEIRVFSYVKGKQRGRLIDFIVGDIFGVLCWFCYVNLRCWNYEYFFFVCFFVV